VQVMNSKMHQCAFFPLVKISLDKPIYVYNCTIISHLLGENDEFKDPYQLFSHIYRTKDFRQWFSAKPALNHIGRDSTHVDYRSVSSANNIPGLEDDDHESFLPQHLPFLLGGVDTNEFKILTSDLNTIRYHYPDDDNPIYTLTIGPIINNEVGS
jgi:hypothetical protein